MGPILANLVREDFFKRALLCREEQLLLRFFSEGSRQLKLIQASLAKRSEESAGLLFS